MNTEERKRSARPDGSDAQRKTRDHVLFRDVTERRNLRVGAACTMACLRLKSFLESHVRVGRVPRVTPRSMHSPDELFEKRVRPIRAINFL